MKTPFHNILKEVTLLLNEKLPEYLTYHNTAHTLYVLDKAIHIAEKEGVNKKDLQLVKIAALYHDIGFIKSHTEHEEEGCKIASKQLKAYGYSKEDIDKVCGMIMATKIPQKPKTPLENIIADADLEYFGTNRFRPVSELLFKELRHYNPSLSEKEWNKIQIEFLEKHNYHTKYCNRYKDFRKQRNLGYLKDKT